MKRIIMIILAAVCVLAQASGIITQRPADGRLSPRLLNYQGYLTDTQGNPVTNPSLSLSFAIFDAASGGSQKWAETQSSVSVDKGIFNVLLGGVTPIPDSIFKAGADRWLELVVGGQTLAPRTRIVSIPYAYSATYSDTALYAVNSAPDFDWTYRITDTADTTLQAGGRWGLARAGNTLYGNADSTHVNLGINSTTGANGQNYKYNTVGGGYDNDAVLSYSTVAGGVQNNANGQCATVGGGSTNVATSECATVAGGNVNTAGGYNATVSGGQGNIASGYIATVGGGKVNRARGAYSVVSGGGGPNYADSNSAIGDYSAIFGGRTNTASGYASTVGGGANDRAIGNYGTVAGGAGNTASGSYSTISGGIYNMASGHLSAVGGGQNNTTSDSFNFIGAGYLNSTAGKYSAILGGYADTIIPGGAYSYLFGINSNLTQDSTFMVDMPHVRFGTEAAGYEFPVADGSSGEALVTNGSGQVGWASTTDNDWTYLVSDGADTTLQMGGRWGLARPGNILFGNADSTHVNFGVACTTGTSGQNYKYITISGGRTNVANNDYATVGGGSYNLAGDNHATVGGGYHNYVTNDYSTIAGGRLNAASGAFTTVGGGHFNRARGNFSVVSGGGGDVEADSNSAFGNYSTISGGIGNRASGLAVVIAGGSSNVTSSDYANVSGGYLNTASGDRATVSGGSNNTASGLRSTIGGGWYNTASNYEATVGGGTNNNGSGNQSTIAGGGYNISDGTCSAIGGGYGNSTSGNGGVISGGESNNMVGSFQAIGGGKYNDIQGDYANIGGGEFNQVLGYYSSIPGGYADTITATGDYSYLFGINSNLTQDSTLMVDMPHIWFGTEANGYEFPITDGTNGKALITNGSGKVSWGTPIDLDWTISGNNMYSAVSGNVGVGASAPTAKLDVAGSTGYDQVRMRTTYTPTSSADANGNIGDVAWDDSYVYVKTSTGWKRSALSTW